MAPRLPRRGVAALAGLLLVALAACDGPIVPRSPEALYSLAQQQLANSQFRAATDTLKRLSREFPTTEQGRQAAALHIVLEGGLARGYRSMGDAYLAGSKQTVRLRAVGMDYFGRARGESIEMMESAEWLMKQPAAGAFRLDARPLPRQTVTFVYQVRTGKAIDDVQRAQSERAEIWEGIDATARAMGGTGAAVEPAVLFLGVARELVEAVDLYDPKRLDETQMTRLYHERAAGLARHAAQLAQAKGDGSTQKEAEALVRRCQEALARR